MSLIIGEVIETGDLSYNIDPTSDLDKILSLGTIRVKLVTNAGVGNVDIVYARPLTMNINLMPMNGELVVLLGGPAIDSVESNVKNDIFYYLPFPINATDDIVINQVTNTTTRTTKKEQNSLQTDNPTPPGRTFPFPCRPISPLQPYEGDMILQNRGGASLRLGTGTSNNKQYHKKPKHHKDTKKGDPTFSMTLERPGPPKSRPGVELPKNITGNKSQGDKSKSQTFRTEDLATNLTGIFGGISQQFSNVKMGRARRIETKRIPSFKKPQILLDTSRIVLNAKRDNLFLIAKNKVILEGRKFLISTDEHHVDFDDLVNRVQDLAKELHRLTSAQAFYSTPFGPTGPASNIAEVLRIHVLCQIFQILPPLSLIGPSVSPPANYNFGVNTVKPLVKNRRLKKASSVAPTSPGSTSPAIASNIDSIAQQNSTVPSLVGFLGGISNLAQSIGDLKLQGEGFINPKSLEIQIREDYINQLEQESIQDSSQTFDPKLIENNSQFSGPTGLPKFGCGIPCDINGNPIIAEGCGLTTQEPDVEPLSNISGSKEDSIGFNNGSNILFYDFICDKFDNQTGVTVDFTKKLALVLGDSSGWYDAGDNPENFQESLENGTAILLTTEISADNDCLKRNILNISCEEGTILTNIKVQKS